MDSKVTPRIIAYAARLVSRVCPTLFHNVLTSSQLHTDAGNWTHKAPQYYNVDYFFFYEFIVDFIEDVHTEEVIARSNSSLNITTGMS